MNTIKLAQEIEERYRRYLKTTFYFRDPVLRASFEDALRSGRLSKGPYLEATPIFKREASTRGLFEDLLGGEPEQAFLKAVQGERPLYSHQEESIRRVFEDRNVIIATGTGSGKTEAFLYPILLHLYQEFQAGALCPGVRALVLYPMNALANDQRERLGEISKRLVDENSPFRFTFGQYIGETPDDEDDSRSHARDHIADRKAGELVLRSEMRTAPPHILLTNYSMLEYLLLRPEDSPLFDDGRAWWWTFLVLDEAHQYRGAKGIEMAMLLRRLKQRLREGGREKPFRCLATSATLVSGTGNKSAVAKFASDLFGEEFRDQEVILGEVETIPDTSAVSLGRDDYQLLSRALEGGTEAASQLAGVAGKLAVSVAVTGDSAQAVGSLLQRDHRAAQLRRLVTNPAEVQVIGVIADEIFADLPPETRVDALSDLVGLLLGAEDPVSAARLLSARYHLFIRSLEGAFLSFWPDKKVLLDRRTTGETALFEVALCKECGQHYLVGTVTNNKLLEAIRDPGRSDFGATFFLPVDDQPVEDEDADDHGTQSYRLCVRCGEIRRSPEQVQCDHNASILLLKQEGAEEREDKIPRCAVCGYQAPDPVREVVHGTDGPHAVIATTLYQNLPEKRKKVLAFADGRQEAAFFAWYLEDSYKDILSRNSVLKIARSFTQDPAGGISLYAIADKAFHSYHNTFKKKESDDEPTIRKNIWRALYREFLTDEQRISLEGVGLVRWSVRWPDWFKVSEVFINPPWSITEQEAWNLMSILLDSMRADRAVELRTEANVSLNWSDLGLQASQMRVRIGPPRRPKGAKNWPVQSWDGKAGKRARFLAKLLIKTGLSEQEAFDQAITALRSVWETFRQCDEHAPTSNDRLLIPVDDARRVNPDWWRLRFVREGDSIHRCDTCGRIQAVSVRGLCPRHRCPGSLKEIQRRELDPNHYRLLYEAELPGSLRVEEHTAQLDKEQAREFQREFREGKIHVLSCSTTFELGVDLGDLDTIFLRNVPPEAFNYAQRVGRAGRRSGHPGFAITYCKRGPHDLYHFAEPNRMLSGKVQPPVLTIRNEKIVTRHVTAIALSFFFRAFAERFQTVESLFKDLSSPSGVAEFTAFLVHNRPQLEETIRGVVPEDMLAQLGLSDGRWISEISGENSRFALAQAEVSSDYRSVQDLRKASFENGDDKTVVWAGARAKTIAQEKVLSFLSRKAVIPKYGFPVDVVELDTQQTQGAFDVSLQRDLSIAISEFAPTSKLVANKKEWTSYGLKKVAEREWDRRSYKRCIQDNVFLQWKKKEDPEPPTPCGHRLTVCEYVMPRFGFVTDRDKPKEPKARPAKVFSTRPYFDRYRGPEPETIPIPAALPLVGIRKASPGWMVVLCEGRRGEGFYLCGACGAGFRNNRRPPHKTPQGQECRGTLEQVSLGHEFVTDVLQLQFHPVPQNGTDIASFAFSLAYAVVEGAAEVLEVPSIDLSTTVAHSDKHAVPPIILYDNVPGGAGLVARLETDEVLKCCLQAALKRVEGGCGCAPNTSCYGCLRSYRNQFVHQLLQRGPIQRYLESVLSAWA